MRDVLYDPNWQKLRVSCLSDYHRAGGFATEAGTQDNLNRLNQYLQAAANAITAGTGAEGLGENPAVQTADEAYRVRVWRVLNLLNATRQGYRGTGAQGTPRDVAVGAYRDSIQEGHMGGTVLRVNKRWDWDAVKFGLEVMWRNDRYWFTAIYKDMRGREYRALRRRGEVSTRPELVKFLQLMAEVNLM